MKAKRAFIRALDRTGSRRLLSSLSTIYARRQTGRNVAVFFDEVWIRALDSEIFVADTPRFDYFADDLLRFTDLVRRMSEEAKDYWFHVYQPRIGDVIIDVGAGVGFDTLIFSRSVGTSGKVISIEAHPKTFSSLKKFCELNHLTNTTCLQLAVVDNKREVYMDDLPDNLVNSAAVVPSEGTVFKVPGMSLDQICRLQQVERIDFLKVNIEGAERLAIAGMAEMIARTKYACVACHDFRADESQKFSTREVVLDFLRRNNFQVVMRPDDPRRYVRDHLHAVNKELVADWPKIAELAGIKY